MGRARVTVHREPWKVRHTAAMSRWRDAQAEYERAAVHVRRAKDALDDLYEEARRDSMRALTGKVDHG